MTTTWLVTALDQTTGQETMLEINRCPGALEAIQQANKIKPDFVIVAVVRFDCLPNIEARIMGAHATF